MDQQLATVTAAKVTLFTPIAGVYTLIGSCRAWSPCASADMWVLTRPGRVRLVGWAGACGGPVAFAVVQKFLQRPRKLVGPVASQQPPRNRATWSQLQLSPRTPAGLQETQLGVDKPSKEQQWWVLPAPAYCRHQPWGGG